MECKNSVCCFSSSTDCSSPILLWELTNLCNLKCPYCHVNVEERKNTALGFNRSINLLREMKQSGFSTVIFSGGEPLLYPKLEELLSESKCLGLKSDICTNGVLINNSSVSMLKKYLSNITITMDSISSIDFDLMKGVKGVHKSVIEGIQLLLSNRFNVNITIVVTSLNLKDIDATVDYLFGIGVRSISLLGLYDFHSSEDYRLSYQQQVMLTSIIQNIIKRYKDTDLHLKIKGINFHEPNIGECKAGEFVFGVDVYGYLHSCILIRTKAEDLNLNKVSLQDAINSNTIRQIVDGKKGLNCSKCLYDSQCKKGCLGAGYLKYQKITPDIRCNNCDNKRGEVFE